MLTIQTPTGDVQVPLADVFSIKPQPDGTVQVVVGKTVYAGTLVLRDAQ